MSRNCGSARTAATRPKPSSRGIITSLSSRSGRWVWMACNAASPSGTACHVVLRSEQSHDVVSHVGIVVGQQDTVAHRRGGRIGAEAAQRAVRIQEVGGEAGAASGLRQPAQRFFHERRRRGAFRHGAATILRYLVRGQMHVTERQGDADRRAGARLALHADGAAVQADQFMHQRQADAGAFHGASALALDPMEAIEDTRQFLRGNADAGVADEQFRRAVVAGAAPPRECRPRACT